MKRVVVLIKTVSVLFCLLFFQTHVFAAPTINGVSGNIVDGSNIQLFGEDFMSNALNIKSLVGANGMLEQAASGSIPNNSDGWVFNEGSGTAPTVSTTQAHSGTKSLYHYTDSSHYNSALRCDYGSYIGLSNHVYVTWWTRANWSTDGQWKMFRINWQNDIQDDAPQMTMFNWVAGVKQFMNRPGPTTGSAGTDNYMNQVMSSDQNIWYRLELIIDTNSVNGASDGTYRMNRYTPGSSVATSIEINKMIFNDAPQYWRWFLWQNYTGNGMTGWSGYADDHFIQVGTQARVELCNGSTWASRTSCDIQIPTAWSLTSITTIVNTGAYSPGDTAYLYIVDANGEVNDIGSPVIIGESGGATIISPPPEVRIEL